LAGSISARILRPRRGKSGAVGFFLVDGFASGREVGPRMTVARMLGRPAMARLKKDTGEG
jgi:hypothetical protein